MIYIQLPARASPVGVRQLARCHVVPLGQPDVPRYEPVHLLLEVVHHEELGNVEQALEVGEALLEVSLAVDALPDGDAVHVVDGLPDGGGGPPHDGHLLGGALGGEVDPGAEEGRPGEDGGDGAFYSLKS